MPSAQPRREHVGVWRILNLELAEPLEDVETSDCDGLHVIASYRGVPVAQFGLPTPLDFHPGQWLADELALRANPAMHRIDLRRAALPPHDRELPPATVVVCTRDRPEALRRCARSLAALSPPVDEVLVVDNGDPSSGTAEVAREAGFRYVREPLAGLSRARNRALGEVSTDIVLFTDDDVEVDPGWAGRLLEHFGDPLVGAVTGLVLPREMTTRAQRLFETHSGFSRGFVGRVVDGATMSPYRAGSTGAGASMGFRIDNLRRAGGFVEWLDAGMPTGSGADTLALHQVLSQGYRIIYDAEAVAHHTHRSSLDDLGPLLRNYGNGIFSYLLASARIEPLPSVLLSGLRWSSSYILRRLVRGYLRRPGSPPYWMPLEELRGALTAPLAVRRAERIVATRPPVPIGATSSDGWRQRLERDAVRSATRRPTASVRHELPSVSVVIPTRNRREEVLELVELLQHQRYDDGRLEIVVCLDGDVDGTENALRHRELRRRPTLVRLEDTGSDVHHGHGAGPVRNRGAAAATNDVILFLDDDVRPVDRELLLRHAAAHGDADTVAVGPCPPSYRDEDRYLPRIGRGWWVDQTRHLIDGQWLGFTDLTTANVSLERGAFLGVGGFEALPRREDWELGYRLLQRGCRLQAVPGAIVEHHGEPTVASYLDDVRREGTGDARFMRLHPETYGALTLLHWRYMGPRRRRIVRALLDGAQVPARFVRGAGPPLLDLLERGGLPERFSRGLGNLSAVMYWTGVAEEVGSLSTWRSLVASAEAVPWEPAGPHLDLVTGALELPRPGQRQELRVLMDGVFLDSAPMRWGGIPWSRAAMLDAVLAEHGAAARARRLAAGRVPDVA